MKQPAWASVHAIVVIVTVLLLVPFQAHAERDWEFSVSAFGGKALHSNESVKFSDGTGGIVTSGTAQDLNLNDAPTLGGTHSLAPTTTVYMATSSRHRTRLNPLYRRPRPTTCFGNGYGHCTGI
jgi:hypothetical protein